MGVTKDMFIFQLLIEHTLDIVKLADTWIHFFIMTNEKNHDDTTAFFKEHNYFGYNPDYIHFFKQEMVPSVDFNGKIYLEEKGRIAMSPNGNGGWFSSLCKAGHLSKLTEHNIKYINVFSVDNVLQRIADPIFLGAVIKEGYLSGGKVVRKAIPTRRSVFSAQTTESHTSLSTMSSQMRCATSAMKMEITHTITVLPSTTSFLSTDL